MNNALDPSKPVQLSTDAAASGNDGFMDVGCLTATVSPPPGDDGMAEAVALIEEHLGGRVIDDASHYPCQRCAQPTEPGHVLCSDCTHQKRRQAHNQRSTK